MNPKPPHTEPYSNSKAAAHGYMAYTSTPTKAMYAKSSETDSHPIGIGIGARYLDSELSVWLSVDPMSDMYPSTSPFMYVRGNPVMLVDPDGMNDTKYQNGLTKEEIEIDDNIDATEVVWKQEDWNDLKEVKKSYDNNRSNRNISGTDVTGKRPSKKPVGNSGSSSSSKSSESLLKRFQIWWYKKFGIEVRGDNEGGEGYGKKGASDIKVDVTKNPLNPKRIEIGKKPSEIVNERGIPLKEKNMPQSMKMSKIGYLIDGNKYVYHVTYYNGKPVDTTKSLNKNYLKPISPNGRTVNDTVIFD